MAEPVFQLDHAGVQEILNWPTVAAMVNEVAEQIADNVRGQLDDDIPVEVDAYTNDRHAASVAIKHPGGKGFQLQRGVLTRAAGMVGLEVKSR
ncbi:hypothetical protein [Prescottella equi]|uniref:hypothetical protein n=1 Tax=Rhodococcus hoagii TaxID=43767 RepID=UPI0007CD8ED1|nr:hypothetical protein [Prescottella equi]ORL01563.1 hypothetical protein A6F56_04385 [Prescottella equi]